MPTIYRETNRKPRLGDYIFIGGIYMQKEVTQTTIPKKPSINKTVAPLKCLVNEANKGSREHYHLSTALLSASRVKAALGSLSYAIGHLERLLEDDRTG